MIIGSATTESLWPHTTVSKISAGLSANSIIIMRARMAASVTPRREVNRQPDKEVGNQRRRLDDHAKAVRGRLDQLA